MASTIKLQLWRKLEFLFDNNLDSELKSEITSDLPKKWEKHGDLILLPCSSFTRQEWKLVDQDILWKTVAEYFQVKRVAKKGTICNDGHRTPQVTLLRGEDPWVCHVDNKIKYHYDVTKCMFSIGNITEKIRMSKLQCQDEVIVDMFAGIGYFTLPLLVHAKALYVHACEWNEDAVFALKRNLLANKVGDKCTVYLGDNRKVCPEGVADRVIMGLIPTPMASLKAACESLKPRKGGVVHLHCNVESNLKTTKIEPETETDCIISCNRKNMPREWLKWARETAQTVRQTMLDIYSEKSWKLNDITTDILHIERVKSYAPHIDHLVLDLRIIVISPDTELVEM